MSSKTPSHKNQDLCFCNRVSQARVVAAIEQGANTLSKVYDACSAGTGPCGGSCRPKIMALISSHKQTAPTPVAPSIEPVPDAYLEAISLFNRRYYWETHEVLEEIWMNEHGKRRLFYQGIIQASAALYHVLNANPKGVIKLAEEAINKLNMYRPLYMELHLEPLIQTLDNYILQAKEILGNSRSGFNYDELPYLRVGSLMEEQKPGT